MATPKIKIYRLFPGYSSQNDNDIQESVNDQLLPVALKNIMPNNAYKLIGVDSKNKQALIPCAIVTRTDLKFTTDLATNPQALYLRYYKGGINYSSTIMMKQKNRKPVFKKLVNNAEGTTAPVEVNYVFCETKEQAVQIKDQTTVYYDAQNQRWVFDIKDNDFTNAIKTISSDIDETLGQYTADIIDISNVFCFILNNKSKLIQKDLEANKVANGQIVSDFSLNAFLSNFEDMFQKQTEIKDGVSVTKKITHTEIPINSTSLTSDLNPQIVFDVYYTDYQSDSNDIIIQPCLKCNGTGIIDEAQDIKCDVCLGAGETVVSKCNKCYCTACLVDGVSTGKIQCTTCHGEGQIELDQSTTITCSTCNGNKQITCTTCKGKLNTGKVYCDKCNGSGTIGEEQEKCKQCDGEGQKRCEQCAGAGSVQLNRKESIILTQGKGNFKVTPNFKLQTLTLKSTNIFNKPIDGYDYIFTSKTLDNKKFNQLITDKDKPRNVYLNYNVIPKISQVKDRTGLYFASFQQDLYSGNSKTERPNTLYLEYVQLGSMKDYSVLKDVNLQYKINFSNTPLCRGILDLDVNRTVNKLEFRGVYLQGSKYDEKYYLAKGLNFPKAKYYLEVDRGIFDFKYDNNFEYGNQSVICQNCKGTGKIDNETCSICQGNKKIETDYYFCTYYHRVEYAKTFVSDYQTWVAQHLRNNPDIFYGKYDYQGDNYLDANDNPVTVGAIPKYMQSGYTILYRNGAVVFASTMQDLSYTQITSQGGGLVNGVYTGGIARANFAYYKGLQNVVQQKLDYVQDYAGGGYKYKALYDCQYPDSIGRRWVKRDNTAQFIGVSFTTQKIQGDKIKTYNLPDLQTKQLQDMSRYSFAQAIKDDGDAHKMVLHYDIFSNSFDYPFVFKIGNYKKDGDVNIVTTKDPTYFMENRISFKSLQQEEIDFITVSYGEDKTLPVLNLQFFAKSDEFERTKDENGKYNIERIIIKDNVAFQISDVKLYAIDGTEVGSFVLNYELKQYQLNDFKGFQGSFYIGYTINAVLRRSNVVYEQNQQLNDCKLNDEQELILPANYKCAMFNTQQFIFYVNNLQQKVNFKLRVIDFNYNTKSDASTIAYTIKKYQE